MTFGVVLVGWRYVRPRATTALVHSVQSRAVSGALFWLFGVVNGLEAIEATVHTHNDCEITVRVHDPRVPGTDMTATGFILQEIGPHTAALVDEIVSVRFEVRMGGTSYVALFDMAALQGDWTKFVQFTQTSRISIPNTPDFIHNMPTRVTVCFDDAEWDITHAISPLAGPHALWWQGAGGVTRRAILSEALRTVLDVRGMGDQLDAILSGLGRVAVSLHYASGQVDCIDNQEGSSTPIQYVPSQTRDSETRS